MTVIREKFENVLGWCAVMAGSRWAVPLIFALAFGTRLAGYFVGGDRANDDGTYLRIAQNLLAGKGLVLEGSRWGDVYSWIQPGGPLLIAGFLTVFDSIQFPLAIFYITITALSHVAFYLLAKRMFSPSLALFGALAWVAYPPQWFWGSRSNPHVFATAFLVICLWLLFVAWEKRSLWLGLLIGVLWTAVCLMRGEYLLGLGVFAAATIVAVPDRKKAILISLAMLAGCAAAFAPWVARNYRLHQRFVLLTTNVADGIWQSFHPDYNFIGVQLDVPSDLQERLMAEPNEVERSRLLLKDRLDELKDHPGRVVRTLAGNFLHFWRPWLSPAAASFKENAVYTVSFLPLLVLFVWGLPKIPWRNPFWIAVYGFIAYRIMVALPFYVIVRYREAIMPLILLVALLALADVGRQSKKEGKC